MNLRVEVCRTGGGTVLSVESRLSCRRALGVIGRELNGVNGFRADRGTAVLGRVLSLELVDEVRLRYGILILVDGRF
jgi:hypothetical protein